MSDCSVVECVFVHIGRRHFGAANQFASGVRKCGQGPGIGRPQDLSKTSDVLFLKNIPEHTNCSHLEFPSTAAYSPHARNAQTAAVNEQSSTVWQAIRAYPLAIFWAFWVCMTIVMEGYSLEERSWTYDPF